MSDPEVIVTVEDDPLLVSVDTGTPLVTVTDLTNPADITIISAQPTEIVVADHKPQVNVNLGAGGLMDKTAILGMLEETLDTSHLTPEIEADIFLLRDLWARIGKNVDQLLIDADVDSIHQAAMTYTDEKVQTTVTAIDRIDEDILATQSSITQTATDIGLQVTALDYKNTQEFIARDARMDISDEAISSSVSRIDAVLSEDGTTGLIKQIQSDIVQTADRITQEVVDREALANGQVNANTTLINQTAEAIISTVEQSNVLSGRIDSTEERMTATEVVTTALSESIVDSVYSLKAIESLTANKFGVTIEEDVGGTSYVAGFEMLVYPEWLESTPEFTVNYVVGDVIMYSDDLLYDCILDHESSATNSPGSVDADTYWTLRSEGVKSEFNVRADHFQVIVPGGTVPLFSVDGVSGEVVLNSALLASIIKSTNYDAQEPGESWFIIDATTGQAKFNNIAMTFGSSTDKRDFRETIGVSNDSLFSWEGIQLIPASTTIGSAYEFIFNSDYEEGALVQIEVNDAYAGKLRVALNGEDLTEDKFGDIDMDEEHFEMDFALEDKDYII